MSNKVTQFFIRVVYGFKKNLEIVILGELQSGTVKEGMHIQVKLESGNIVGSWKIIEVLHTSFINQYESPNFMGLVVKCNSISDFELLKSLRIYDEVVTILEKK